jgi:hypothetical protein
MTLTPHILRQEFEATRIFYKSGLKSGNKIYQPSGPNSRGVQKWRKRYENHLIANENMPSSRAMVRALDLSMTETGNYLIEHEVKWGNCTEMAFVLAARLRLCDCGSSTIYFAAIKHPGDHAFIIVSLDGTPPPSKARVLDFRNWNGRGFQAVDPWMNICCPINEYPSLGVNKLRKWSSVDKKVLYGNKWTNPLNLNYVCSFMTGPVEFTEFD